ncbi:MAG: hypothetical protein RI935_287 [Candidatus Parcubacteria bacterium]|jgi:peptidoglycan hydrolase-like protein with peptidoglycan-binding domain
MKKIATIITLIVSAFALQNSAFAGYFSTTPLPVCDARISNNLARGSENDDVLRLQNLLARTGYLNASPNGYFGYQTERAVKAFQRDNGLHGSGIVGEQTRNFVNERMCDTDSFSDETLYYGGYSSLTTYVNTEDPFVKVVLPNTSSAILSTPSVSSLTSTSLSSVLPVNTSVAVTNPEIAGTSIVYNPAIGYTYSIIPASGSLTVTSPVANSVFKEGDTVTVVWGTKNLTASTYSILLENTSVGQSYTVAQTNNTSFSFVLTKEILDGACAGACNASNQGSYRIVVATPTKDIAGTISTLRAAVQPITVVRQFGYSGQVSITTNKTPVTSGEPFKLYINIPRGASWDTYLAGNYSIKIKASCPSGVSASIAGTLCGQEFVIPFAPTFYQQEVPAVITNGTWFRQNVQFDLTVTNLAGQTIGTSQTNVIVNGTPFSW